MNGPEGLPERRSLLVDRAARSAGEDWAHAFVAELGAEGRSAAGGWPGTLSEARARVWPRLASALASERLQPAIHTEVDGAARTAYARARAVWAALAKADDSEDLLTETPAQTSPRQGRSAR